MDVDVDVDESFIGAFNAATNGGTEKYPVVRTVVLCTL